MKSLVLSMVLLGAGLALAGCGDPQVPNCPAAGILTDTSTITGFRAGAPADPSGEAYTAEVVGLQNQCDLDKDRGATDTSMTLAVRASRPPSAEAADFTIPYYIAISQGERLLSKKLYTLDIHFDAGSAVTSLQQSLEDAQVTLETGHPPTDYQILVGFQLTEAQRAYAASRSRFAP